MCVFPSFFPHFYILSASAASFINLLLSVIENPSSLFIPAANPQWQEPDCFIGQGWVWSVGGLGGGQINKSHFGTRLIISITRWTWLIMHWLVPSSLLWVKRLISSWFFFFKCSLWERQRHTDMSHVALQGSKARHCSYRFKKMVKKWFYMIDPDKKCW